MKKKDFLFLDHNQKVFLSCLLNNTSYTAVYCKKEKFYLSSNLHIIKLDYGYRIFYNKDTYLYSFIENVVQDINNYYLKN